MSLLHESNSFADQNGPSVWALSEGPSPGGGQSRCCPTYLAVKSPVYPTGEQEPCVPGIFRRPPPLPPALEAAATPAGIP